MIVSESESVLTSATAFPGTRELIMMRLNSDPHQSPGWKGSLLGQKKKTAAPAKGRGLCSLSVIREICHLGRE